jgi:hypothetical protein
MSFASSKRSANENRPNLSVNAGSYPTVAATNSVKNNPVSNSVRVNVNRYVESGAM